MWALAAGELGRIPRYWAGNLKHNPLEALIVAINGFEDVVRGAAWIETRHKVLFIGQPDFVPEPIVIVAKSVIARLSPPGSNRDVDVDPDGEVEGSINLGMKQSDRIDDEYFGIRNSFWGSELSRTPVEAPELRCASRVKRVDYLAAQPNPFHTVPVGRAAMRSMRIEKVVPTNSSASIDRGAQRAGERGLSRSPEPGDPNHNGGG